MPPVLQGRERDFGDLLDVLFQLAAFLFIVLLPVLRTVLQRMRKREGPVRLAAPPRRPGLERWEEILRGEGEAKGEASPPGPAARPPARGRPSPAHPPARSLAVGGEGSRESSLPGTASPPVPSPAAGARRRAASAQSLGEHLAETVREDLAATMLARDTLRHKSERDAEETETARWGRAAARHHGGLAAWRQAFVLSEVLGRPLAVRPPRSAAGGAPPGDA